MRKKPYLLFSVFILLSVFISCRNSDREKIEDVLSKRERAFETKNLELYLSCISPNYREEKNGRSIGIEEVKKNFLSNTSVFDQIKISHSNRTIYLNGEKAEVAQRTAVEVKLDKEEGHFTFKENIGFERIGGKWLIVKESDTDFLKGFVFGELK
ncbi:MAG: hypothetical protein C4291_11765 [Candidatus Dadabacteria bacterium]